MRRLSMVLLLSLASFFAASAGVDAHSDSSGWYLTVRTTGPESEVMIDSVRAGHPPIARYQVSPGTHVLTIHTGSERSWFSATVVETLSGAPGAEIERAIALPVRFRINSEPYGAEVRMGDSLLGTTPLIVTSRSNGGMVNLSREGFADESIPLSANQPNIDISLRPVSPEAAGYSPLSVSGEGAKNLGPVFIASGGTALAGIASAYFKIKADNRYNDYKSTGDPAILDEVHRLDRNAAIALVASELGIFALSYLLLSR